MSAALVSAFHHDFRDLCKGLQSHRASSDLRQHMSLALERQLVNSYTSSLILPGSNQGSSVPAINTIPNFSAVKTSTKQHPPLTASNSVANCNAASHLKAAITREHRKLDRSISEPVDRSQQTVRPVQSNSSRYKTELCRPFEENGTCKYGDKCQFAHGINELRTLTRHPKYKTELCRTFHSTGFCPYGPRCHFIHNSEDSKKCLLNTLQSSTSIPVNGNAGLSSSKITSHGAPKDLDICSFSIGSAGDLSPTSSTSSSGSPTSSLGGFFVDDNPTSYIPQVPQTAPPTVGSGFFFGPDYTPLKPLPALSPLIQQQEFYPPQQGYTSDDNVSSIDMLVSEMDNLNCLGGTSSNIDVPTKPQANNTELDINRNVIRLPIFSRLAHGTSP
ncbi:mRNA decay activator protein ZFP36L2-A-like isoform X2 [Stegodyphus dumicola]|uniref:mRNA decay activator protein ZFP36L2-A-like isoform X2 n=1 Tax=Stegodyphus dumicola TaxID=202533 RepID=UPI0015B04229|nr:mRNA decay activator protein ZFP36L2-A-like isoform X2 [Stegodyphus dumicola]